MSLVIGTLQKMKTKGMESDEGGDIGPRQNRTELIQSSYDETFNKSLKALKHIGAKVKTSNKNDGFILAKMPMSWKSFGEVLEVIIAKESDEQIKVRISSSPSLKTTMVDYGKSRQNVNSFFEALKS